MKITIEFNKDMYSEVAKILIIENPKKFNIVDSNNEEHNYEAVERKK